MRIEEFLPQQESQTTTLRQLGKRIKWDDVAGCLCMPTVFVIIFSIIYISFSNAESNQKMVNQKNLPILQQYKTIDIKEIIHSQHSCGSSHAIGFTNLGNISDVVFSRNEALPLVGEKWSLTIEKDGFYDLALDKKLQ